MSGDQIKKIVRKDGTTKYRFVVDIGRDPETGKRKQITKTFDTKREAKAEYSRIRHQTGEGTYVRPLKLTLDEYLNGWLEGATRDRRASTKRSYTDAMLPARERLGKRLIQQITKADIEALVTWITTSGRRRGGVPGSALSGRSAALTLGRLTAALEMALNEGIIVRNVAKLVKPPQHQQTERKPWSQAAVLKFLGVAKKDRLHAAWRLSLYGLRRGEVLGLRWDKDIDLVAKTLTVTETRVLVNGDVVIGEPKSRNGERTLPLDDDLVAALMTLRLLLADEKEAAGEAYEDSGYLVVDELGAPVRPKWYSEEFDRIRKRAGAPRITLHDSRHTTLSLMEKAGVPISIVSKWAGHYDAAFTYAKYVHASDDDLKVGTDVLEQLYKIT